MKKQFEIIKKEFNGKYLFKRDVEGSVIYWAAKVNEHENRLYFYYGKINSNFTSDTYKSKTDQLQGVNQGKSNATTDVEQCYKRLESEYKDKLKKGYKHTPFPTEYVYNIIDYLEQNVAKVNTDINDMAKPMKCQPFKLKKFKYPCYGQYKFNGVRCIAFKNKFNTDLFDAYPITFLSKEGLEYKVDHLKKQIFDILTFLEEELCIINPVLDGELYIPYTPVTTIGGAAKNSNNTHHKLLQYVIFDLSIENFSQQSRKECIEKFTFYKSKMHISNEMCRTPEVYTAHYYTISNDEEALEFLDDALKLGYEGFVLREIEPEYAFGQRPKTMMKLKRFEDAEFEVVDVVQYGDSNSKVGTGCKLICRNDLTDSLFEVTPVGDTDYRLQLVRDKENIIGKMATVKFYERTVNNLPFHANVIAIRDYEK